MNRKNAARTKEATLLALVSKPQVMSAAPIKEEPKYPAGRVNQGIPPDMLVEPPSSAMSKRVSLSTSDRKMQSYDLVRRNVS